MTPRGIDRQTAFWKLHLRVGNGILVGESAVVVIYLLMTRGRLDRTVLLVMAGSSIAAGLIPFALAARIASKPWRVEFSIAWTLLSGGVLAAFIHLDGGLGSPLLGLMMLPIMYAALAMRPYPAAVCGVAGLVELFWIGMTDPDPLITDADLLMLCAIVGGVAVLSLASSINRTLLESRDASFIDEQVKLADTDGLTGCLTHRAVMARLDLEVERAVRHGGQVSLLVVDVDLLKEINDTRGHQAGDAALADVGAVLRSSTRGIDASGRVGGDEFAVVLPDSSVMDAEAVAARITQALRELPGAAVTVSIGASSLDPALPTSKKLFAEADAAMYRAKAAGRGGVARALRVPDAQTEGADRRRLEKRLRQSERTAAEALTILSALESTAPVGFGFVDREFRILRVNAVLAAVNGRPLAEQLGRTLAEVVPAIWPQVEKICRHVLDTGEAVSNIEVQGDTADDPGRVHHWLASYNPVTVDGEVVGIGVIAADVTDRMELEQMRLAVR